MIIIQYQSCFCTMIQKTKGKPFQFDKINKILSSISRRRQRTSGESFFSSSSMEFWLIQIESISGLIHVIKNITCILMVEATNSRSLGALVYQYHRMVVKLTSSMSTFLLPQHGMPLTLWNIQEHKPSWIQSTCLGQTRKTWCLLKQSSFVQKGKFCSILFWSNWNSSHWVFCLGRHANEKRGLSARTSRRKT